MVDYTEEYKRLLQIGVYVYDELTQLYISDRHVENDWADITLAEIRTKRNGMAERLQNLPTIITAENTSPVMLSIDRFIDSHWADYQEFPVADGEKRKALERMHTELEAVASGIGQIYNAVRGS